MTGSRVTNGCMAMLTAVAMASTAVSAADDSRPSVLGGVYDKPHLDDTQERGTVVGGYIDHELFWNDERKTFDQHRFIPFIHGTVSDRIHVAAEIEFEHGGNVGGDGEVKLEFATMDITFSEAVNYRGGVILSPLGRFNLIHDSPLNDLSNRPLVNREIIPTTLSEAGMGLYGVVYPNDSALLGYEIYVVNGFNEAAATSIRSGRGSQKDDNNDEKSIVGRVNYSPVLGLDLGVSGHLGAYDDAGRERLTIVAIDASWNRGPWDARGEFAKATIGGVPADSRSGYYGQLGYHFLPGAIDIFPNSVFTVSARYDFIDLDTRDETRYTFGLNFRPEEDTVMKLDYEVWDNDDDKTGVVLSVASYF